MNIILDNEIYRLDVYDILSIFLPHDSIVFVSHGEGEIFSHDSNAQSTDFLVINTNGRIALKFLEKGRVVFQSFKNMDDLNLDSFISYRMAIKYEILSFFINFFKKSSPWGILTGIRPVKVATKLLKSKTFEETLSYLENRMLLSSKKAKLISDISTIQKPIRENISREGYSLYINIPFCTGRCSYCSYSTLILEKNGGIVKSYIESLLKEMKELNKILNGRKLSTIYIGGGTPTSLKLVDLKNLLQGINEIYDLEKVEEFTVEAGREDSLTLEKLKALKDNKITRISLNPQSFKEDTLLEIGRKQDNANLINMYNQGRNLDFDSINMDLIVGLPNEDIRDFNHTLEVIERLKPDNLTVHTLALKKGSRLLQNGGNLQSEFVEAKKMMDRALDFSFEKGYIPYYLYRQKRILGNLENIGFSKPEKICKYNIYMMEELQDIIGIGMGSGSKFLKDGDLIINHRNYMNMRDYLGKLEEIIEEKKELIISEK